jgi:Zn-dependent protease
MSGFNLLGFLLVLAGWMFSLCLHEFAHALVAYYGGDTSVRDKGYLSFNPARYTNPIDSLVWPLVFLLIGGLALPGGAVYVNRAALRSRGWDCAVSVAGPAANLFLFAFLMVPFWLGLVPKDPMVTWKAYAFVCELQVIAALFNLIPVPPLDGFGAVSAFMDPVARARAYGMGYITFILVLILFSGTSVGREFWRLVETLTMAAGLPLDLAEAGRGYLRIFGRG